MVYSFKKLLQFDFGIYNVFIIFIIFSIFFVIGSIAITMFVINGLVYEISKDDGLLLPIVYLVVFLGTLTSLIILLTKSRNINNFQGNCSEITAKIESFKPLKNKYGNEIGYKIIFSYDYNNLNYAKGYSIKKNEHTAACLKNYLKLGETVKILVGNNNPEKIMIKEIFR